MDLFIILAYTPSMTVCVIGDAHGKPFESTEAAERVVRRLERQPSSVRHLVLPVSAATAAFQAVRS